MHVFAALERAVALDRSSSDRAAGRVHLARQTADVGELRLAPLHVRHVLTAERELEHAMTVPERGVETREALRGEEAILARGPIRQVKRADAAEVAVRMTDGH